MTYLPLKQNETTFAEKEKQCSVWKTILNLLNFMEGVGFLSLPYALHRGGMAAVIGLLVLPFFLGYLASLLVECIYDMNENGERIRVRSSYQEVALHCWAPLKHVISIGICTYVFILTVSYVVLFSSMMHQIFPSVSLTESQWACVATAIALPTVFLEYLSKIAWLSLFALLALFGSVCLCLTYEFQEAHKWDVQSLMFWETQGVVIALTIIFFSYSLHVIVIQVEGEMADKSKFNVALASTYSIGAVIKTVFAVAGFLTYSSITNEVILNNLPIGIPTKIIATLFSLSVLITYPITFLVFVKIIEESPIYEKITGKIHPKVCYITLRVGLVFLILGAAVLLPHFALLASLGGCFNCLIIIFFPGLFHLRLKYEHLSRSQVLYDCFLVIFGIATTCFGLFETISAFILTD